MYWILLIPILLVVIVFSATNSSEVTLSFWPFDFAADVSLPMLLLVSFAVGFLSAVLIYFRRSVKMRLARQSDVRKIKALHLDIEGLEKDLVEAKASYVPQAFPAERDA